MPKFNVEIWLDLRNEDVPTDNEMRTKILGNQEIEAENADEAVARAFDLVHCSVLDDK